MRDRAGLGGHALDRLCQLAQRNISDACLGSGSASRRSRAEPLSGSANDRGRRLRLGNVMPDDARTIPRQANRRYREFAGSLARGKASWPRSDRLCARKSILIRLSNGGHRRLLFISWRDEAVRRDFPRPIGTRGKSGQHLLCDARMGAGARIDLRRYVPHEDLCL